VAFQALLLQRGGPAGRMVEEGGVRHGAGVSCCDFPLPLPSPWARWSSTSCLGAAGACGEGVRGEGAGHGWGAGSVQLEVMGSPRTAPALGTAPGNLPHKSCVTQARPTRPHPSCFSSLG